MKYNELNKVMECEYSIRIKDKQDVIDFLVKTGTPSKLFHNEPIHWDVIADTVSLDAGFRVFDKTIIIYKKEVDPNLIMNLNVLNITNERGEIVVYLGYERNH